ncbi:hypothetical protein CsSME_00035775 [Camellia sinensis var. sinensis]
MDSTQLRLLDLSSNDLVGQIPVKLGRMVSLFKLKLDDNHLLGNIPPDFSKLSNLEILNLAANDLSGSIPRALEKCKKLWNLKLSNNRFGESIPSEIGRVHNLQILDLGHNLLRGKIPQQIGELQMSETLNLSHNELSGFIPSSFDNMLGLTSIDLSFNQLDGLIPNIKAFREAPFEALRVTENFSTKYCVGEGGCGIVYRADLTSGQVVAVKKLHVLPDGDLANLKGFTRGSLGKILSMEDQVLYFDWIKRVNVVKDVANALSYMHHDCTPAIIHRDISSKNVLLDLEYAAHISDFGTSRFMKPDSSNWPSFAGTIGYAAPELAYTMEVNERCNVYSFGVLTLEVIMGKHPGDLTSSLSSSSSSYSSSTSTAHGILLKDVLDQRLPAPENQVAEQVVVVAKLAFACLQANPLSRPTMRQVAMKLSDDRRTHAK